MGRYPPMAPATRAQRISQIFVLATWSALVAGIAQVLIVGFNLLVRERIVFQTHDFVWAVPLAYVVVVLLVAVGVSALVLISPRLVPFRLAVVLFLSGAAMALLSAIGPLSRWGVLLLGLGIGIQGSRFIRRAPEQWLRRLTRTSIAMAVVVLCLGLTKRATWRVIAERRAIAGLPPAPTDAPNVLLLVLDTVRAASMGVYGLARNNTPNIQQLAADGVVYEHAFSTAPWTLPSHTSMFTGLYPHETSADFLAPLDGKPRTLAEAFAANGYFTAGFAANRLYTAYDSGLERGFQHYDDYDTSLKQTFLSAWPLQMQLWKALKFSRSPRQIIGSFSKANLEVPIQPWSDQKPARDVTREFLEWRTAHSDRPFFAFLNFYDAHHPYISPPEFSHRYSANPKDQDLYEGAIAYIDDQLGRLFAELRRRGELDRTIVVVTSDHGELFGEHGLYQHTHNLYLPVLHIPLIIRYPSGVPKGVRVNTAVTIRDLAATIAELARLPLTTPFPGRSLVAAANGQPSDDASPLLAAVERPIRVGPPNPTARGPMRSMFDDRLHYILNGDGVEELYDYRADRAEAQNIAGSPEGRAIAAAVRAQIDRLLSKLAPKSTD
ncbi:MAG: sulfatase [Gemmatimonadaceae bacterium]